MSAKTPVCELLGIDHPIVEAPLSADPGLPAAVSNAGALGSVALAWADDAGDLVRETAALTDRPFAGNPAAVVPVSHSPEGLPIGVQLVGRPWEEEQVLAVAAALEKESGPWQAPPIR